MTLPWLLRRARSDTARGLWAWLLGALVVALMTGPSGNTNSPTAGFTGSLLHPRVLVFLALGAALWALTWLRRRYGDRIREVSGRVTTGPGRLVESRRNRYVLYAAVLAVAIAYPTTLSGFWQEVLVDQIGI